MDPRFEYIDEALSAIVLREECIGRILTSETGLEICHHATGGRYQSIFDLRKSLHIKRRHYLECENFIIDIM